MAKTLEEVRVLPAADLIEEDKKTLKENWNDLTPEEQDVFDDTVNSSDDPVTPPEGEGGDDDSPKFKNQKEVDDYIDKRLEEQKAEAEDDPVTPPEGEAGEPPREVPDIFNKKLDLFTC